MITLNGSGADYRGLSTDEKPADAAPNAILYLVDTDERYYFDGEEWHQVAAPSTQTSPGTKKAEKQ